MQMKVYKGVKSIAFALVFTGFSALSADDVTNVVARQRWPWAAKVDIDCVLNATGPRTVEFSATWQGRDTPLKLGAVSNAAPGTVSWSWDPESAGVTLPLEDFRVTAAIGPYKFMLYNIETDTVSWYDEKPAAGWDSITAWRNKAIIFRHVPAGVYTNGYREALRQIDVPNGSSSTARLDIIGATAQRIVRITSDYYIAIALLTVGQKNMLAGNSSGGYHGASFSYDNLRGKYSSDSISWPSTGFRVGGTSYIKSLRDKLEGKIPSGWILDLPTAAQWEIAMRAGTDTIFPNGGDENTTPAGFTNLVNEIAQWGGNNGTTSRVASKTPNAWGIYDMVGYSHETMLDAPISSSSDPVNSADMGIDPVGISNPATTKRQVRGGNYKSEDICGMAPGYMYSGNASDAYGVRLVVNTRDWMASGYRQKATRLLYENHEAESAPVLLRDPSSARVWQAVLVPGEPLSWQWGDADHAFLSVTSLVSGAVAEYSLLRVAGATKGTHTLPMPVDGGEYLYDVGLRLMQSDTTLANTSARVAILPGTFKVEAVASPKWGRVPDAGTGRVFAYDATWTMMGEAVSTLATLVSVSGGTSRTIPVVGTSGYDVVALGNGIGHKARFSLAFDGGEALYEVRLRGPGGFMLNMK